MAKIDSEVGTRKVHRKRISGMSRRRLLKTLSAAGFSGTTAAFLTTDDVEAATSDQAPIVIGFRSTDPDRPHESFSPVTKNVPADWYDNILRARRVKEKMNRTFGGKDGVVGIGTVDAVRGGKNAHVEIDVLPEMESTFLGAVPETVDDVPVKINTSGEATPDCSLDELRDDDSPYISGGSQCEAGVGSEPIGSLLPRLYDNDGTHKFATAQHLFNTGSNGNNYNGTKLYHPTDSGTHIGTVESSHCYDDLVVADPELDPNPNRAISEASPSGVRGQFSKDGLSDLNGRGEWVSKIGRTTCYTSGEIKAIDWTIWSGYGCLPRDHQVKWGRGSSSEGGDSGAPVYHPNPSDTSEQWIVSVDQYSNDGSGDYTGGTSAYSIKNQHGYHF